MFFEHYLRFIIVAVFLIVATGYDVRTRRIPNSLTFSMIIAGLLVSLLFSRNRLIPTAFTIVLLFTIATILPGIGMGDIKLLMGMVAWTSPSTTFLSLAFASIAIVLIYHQQGTEEKQEAAPLAPYLFDAFIIIEGVTMLCVY